MILPASVISLAEPDLYELVNHMIYKKLSNSLDIPESYLLVKMSTDHHVSIKAIKIFKKQSNNKMPYTCQTLWHL